LFGELAIMLYLLIRGANIKALSAATSVSSLSVPAPQL
jgi:hypothetical protein